MFEIRDLRLIREILVNGSLAAAAEVLHTSTSAASHHLKDLERRAGRNLFLRSRKRLVPSAAAITIAQAAGPILGDVDKLLGVLQEDHTSSPSIRLAGECFTCFEWLEPVVLAMRNSGQIEIKIVPKERPELIKSVLAKRLDLALCCTPPLPRSVHVVELFEDEFIAVLPDSDELAGREYLSANDLLPRQLLLYSSPRDSFVVRSLLSDQIGNVVASKVPLTEAMLSLVRVGAGIGFMPSWMFAAVPRFGLKAVRIGRKGVLRRWRAVMNHRHSNHIDRFVELLKAQARRGINPRLS